MSVKLTEKLLTMYLNRVKIEHDNKHFAISFRWFLHLSGMLAVFFGGKAVSCEVFFYLFLIILIY